MGNLKEDLKGSQLVATSATSRGLRELEYAVFLVADILKVSFGHQRCGKYPVFLEIHNLDEHHRRSASSLPIRLLLPFIIPVYFAGGIEVCPLFRTAIVAQTFQWKTPCSVVGPDYRSYVHL